MSAGDPGTAGAAFTDASSLYVRHADDALVVLDKPAGLPCVPGRPAELADCLASRAQARWPDARVVHRLDMATSGLFLMARGLAMQRLLSRAFEQREVDKRYEAVVAGVLSASNGEIDLPLMADWPNRPMQKVDLAQGRPSVTRWRVLEAGTAAEAAGLLLTAAPAPRTGSRPDRIVAAVTGVPADRTAPSTGRSSDSGPPRRSRWAESAVPTPARRSGPPPSLACLRVARKGATAPPGGLARAQDRCRARPARFRALDHAVARWRRRSWISP